MHFTRQLERRQRRLLLLLITALGKIRQTFRQHRRQQEEEKAGRARRTDGRGIFHGLLSNPFVVRSTYILLKERSDWSFLVIFWLLFTEKIIFT